MSDSADRFELRYEIRSRLRAARRHLHATLIDAEGVSEHLFKPEHLLETLREYVAQCTTGSLDECCGKLFGLSVLLYCALEWQFAGRCADIETDVHLEWIRQNHRYGGPTIDDRLFPQNWQTRLQQQLLRLEQQMACDELYADRLIKVTALAQAALEATCRQLHRDAKLS